MITTRQNRTRSIEEKYTDTDSSRTRETAALVYIEKANTITLTYTSRYHAEQHLADIRR